MGLEHWACPKTRRVWSIAAQTHQKPSPMVGLRRESTAPRTLVQLTHGTAHGKHLKLTGLGKSPKIQVRDSNHRGPIMSNYPQAGYPQGNPAPAIPRAVSARAVRLRLRRLSLQVLCPHGILFVAADRFVLRRRSSTSNSTLASPLNNSRPRFRPSVTRSSPFKLPPPLEPVGGGTLQSARYRNIPGTRGRLFRQESTIAISCWARLATPLARNSRTRCGRPWRMARNSQNGSGGENDKTERLKDEKTTKLTPHDPRCSERFSTSPRESVRSPTSRRFAFRARLKARPGRQSLFWMPTTVLPRDKVEEMIDSMQ